MTWTCPCLQLSQFITHITGEKKSFLALWCLVKTAATSIVLMLLWHKCLCTSYINTKIGHSVIHSLKEGNRGGGRCCHDKYKSQLCLEHGLNTLRMRDQELMHEITDCGKNKNRQWQELTVVRIRTDCGQDNKGKPSLCLWQEQGSNFPVTRKRAQF